MMGKAFLGMLSIFAELERDMTRERIMNGKIKKRETKGGFMGGQVTLGYKLVNKRFVVDPDEKALVLRIFREAVDGITPARIASRFNSAGIKGKMGKYYQYSSVMRILQNRTYLGEIKYKHKWHKDTHDAIVDVHLFKKANRVVSKGRRPAHR